MTNQDNPKPVLPSIPTGPPIDNALHGSFRKMKNDADPWIRGLIDDILVGKRTMRDLMATERSGRQARETRPSLEAIRKKAEKLEKEPDVTGRIMEKPE